MTIRNGFLIFTAAACIWPAQGQEQPKQEQPKEVVGKPGAKEIFLSRQIPYIDPDEKPAPAKPEKSTAGTKVKPKPKPNPAQPTATVQAQSGQPASARTAPVIQAGYSSVPLGLRYTVQKIYRDQTTDESRDTKFHAGDQVQLSLEVNDTGYLYVVTQGTSLKWRALFPSAEIENGDNRVQPAHTYTLPPGRKAIGFDDQPGEEHLFVILSRQPVTEIDGLIFSLKGGRQTPAKDARPDQPADPVLTASAELEDSQIVRMRATYTRDLIIEDLGDPGHQKGGQQTDKSVYVVNPKGSADSRVVADITLSHIK
jgi:hypothetical protein